jgi:hypothetical protein
MTKRLNEILVASCLALAPFAGSAGARAEDMSPANPTHSIQDNSKPKEYAKPVPIRTVADYWALVMIPILTLASARATYGIYEVHRDELRAKRKERREEQ